MKAKTHIIVISLIVSVMLILWYVMYGSAEKKAPIVVSGNAIEVVRATYGLECNSVSTSTQTSSTSDESPNIYKENNILVGVSDFCNGRSTCQIEVSDAALNFKGGEGCSGKSLTVEYRCFTVDKLRKESAIEGSALVIDCSKI